MKLLSWSISIALSALLFVGCDTVGSQEMTKPKFIVSQTGNTTFIKGVKMEKNTPSDFLGHLTAE